MIAELCGPTGHDGHAKDPFRAASAANIPVIQEHDWMQRNNQPWNLPEVFDRSDDSNGADRLHRTRG